MSKILAIETSCDETAVALLSCDGGIERASFDVLGNALYSQAAKHAEYGGVYPALAKREHQANLVPLLENALKASGMFQSGESDTPKEALAALRDPSFRESVASFLGHTARPDIDLIAVTEGPGLEPALWTGITFAEALGAAWGVPVLGVDHMEGHLVSALLERSGGDEYALKKPALPALALLVSGGHTELILMREWFAYEMVGETKDDAVGEAFDKVARLLDLAYPGGPKIAELASKSRARGNNTLSFPRPMADDDTCDFSFSGLKTAVLYKLRTMEKLSEFDRENIAAAFEDAARDVFTIKVRRALRQTGAASLLIAGGVSANAEMRSAFEKLVAKEFPKVELRFPHGSLTGDNAVMIGAAGYLRHAAGHRSEKKLSASGNLRRGKKS